jgi:hypothetical protein
MLPPRKKKQPYFNFETPELVGKPGKTILTHSGHHLMGVIQGEV